MRHALVLSVALGLCTLPAASAQLFTPLEREPDAAAKAVHLSGGVTTTLAVAVNPRVLSEEQFDLELDGRRFTAKGRLDVESPEHQVWSGTVEDDAGAEGSMVLTRYRGGTWGEISTPAGTWVVETRDGRTFLHRFDASRLGKSGGCGVGGERPLADFSLPEQAAVASLPTPETIIDVQFWYTRERLAAVGGIGNLMGITLAQLDITNLAEETTGPGVKRFRLVDLLPVPADHAESGKIEVEASWFWNDSTIRRWLNYPTPPSVRPDVQVLLIHNHGPFAAGLADLSAEESSHPQYAHAVIGNWEFASGGMKVLAHELGHILGLRHNREEDPTGAAIHGWLYQIPATGEWRSDVMTYTNFCPGGCHMQAQYSRADRLDEGVPTGLAGVADAYRHLLISSVWVANYRVTDVFGPETWARYKTRGKKLNIRVEIPAGTSTSAKLYKGTSQNGRCVGASVGTVAFKNGVATGLIPMKPKPEWLCLETVQGPWPGTVRFFPVTVER